MLRSLRSGSPGRLQSTGWRHGTADIIRVLLSHPFPSVLQMTVAMFPHHHWADADRLSAPDPVVARTGYFRKDPDGYSRNLQGWHQLLWNRRLPDGSGLELTVEGRGLLERTSALYLSSDAAVPAWERWSEVQALESATERLLQAQGRGTIHDLGWRLYDMGCFVLYPGVRIDKQWTINQAKGCLRRIADRLDLTLECIRRYYDLLSAPSSSVMRENCQVSSPLGEVLHRYRTFFELFGSFAGYVDFWKLEDLVIAGPDGLQVRFLMPRDESGTYDFERESALPQTAEEYCDYLVAADDFVEARNQRLAALAATHPTAVAQICPVCLGARGGAHQRWTL